MNFNPEQKRQRKIILWLFIALLAALLLNNLAGGYIKNMFSGLMFALTPVFIGAFLAYILKKLLDILENKLFKNLFKNTKNAFRNRRIFCLSLIFLVLVFIIALLFAIIIPSIANFITELAQNSDIYIENISIQLTQFFKQFSWASDVDIQKTITDAIQSLVNTIGNSIPVITTTILNIISQTATIIVYVIIGFIIAFLILKDKEKLAVFSKRVVYANFKKERADKMVKVTKSADGILYNYFAGKLLESLVIFITLLPGFYAFNIPYAIGLCALLSILNMIPYIGAIIGTVISAIFGIIFTSVNNVIWFIVYVLIMTTLVGNFISPYIFGKKLKVSSLVMIISFLIGGGLFGMWGMFFAPPLVAILWVFFNENLENKERLLAEKENAGNSTEKLKTDEQLRSSQHEENGKK